MGFGSSARRRLHDLREHQYSRGRARFAAEQRADGRQDPAFAAADRRRRVRDRPRQPRDRRSAGAGDAGAEQHPADLRVCRCRGGTCAERRGKGSGAHGAARRFSSPWPRSLCCTPHCSSWRRACSARRWRPSKAAPLAEAAGAALGGWAKKLLLIGAVVSMLGHAGGMILATPRMLFAFARDGFFRHSWRESMRCIERRPSAILVQCALVLVLAITSTFERLAILANMSTLVLYGDVLRRNLGAPPPRRARRRRAVKVPAPGGGCRRWRCSSSAGC